MTLHYEDAGLRLFHGSNKDILGADALGYPHALGYHPDRLIPDATFDSIVTDPPYELGFMGKGWDSTGIAYDVDVWRECLRVLKPGGYMLAFGGTRTWHRIAVAIEDAGFEIRDSIAWMYGSGFPKSLDVSKAIDKQGGNSDLAFEIAAAIKQARESRGIKIATADAMFCGSTTLYSWFEGRPGGVRIPNDVQFAAMAQAWPELAKYADAVRTVPRDKTGMHRVGLHTGTSGVGGSGEGKPREDAAATDAAKTWQGWGTALKPAFEPIIVARKPLIGTVAANVLAYGTGAINIDACRVAFTSAADKASAVPQGRATAKVGALAGKAQEWVSASTSATEPSTTASTTVDRQAPNTGGAGKASGPSLREPTRAGVAFGARNGLAGEPAFYGGEKGGASRFFPTFRYEAKAPGSERPEVDGVAHATVKPLDLMRWLVRLVTRRGGHVLDLFAGSGTTGEAALLEGMECTLIELEADHLPLILARVRKPLQTSLFGDWEGGAA